MHHFELSLTEAERNLRGAPVSDETQRNRRNEDYRKSVLRRNLMEGQHQDKMSLHKQTLPNDPHLRLISPYISILRCTSPRSRTPLSSVRSFLYNRLPFAAMEYQLPSQTVSLASFLWNPKHIKLKIKPVGLSSC